MKRALHYYRLLNLLSVDVAVGAVCSALFFAKILRTTILPYGLIALSLTVWIIYTVDHLLDARKIKGPAATARHKFHQEHFNLLARIVVLAIIADAVTIFFIRTQVLEGGVVLGIIVVLYFFVHRYIRFLKEFFIAVVYTGGVLLPSVSVVSVTSAIPFVVIIQFILTALINLLIFSWFDLEKDRQDGNTSFATVMGERKTRIVIWILLSAVFLLIPLSEAATASLLIGLMNLLLFIIFQRHQIFHRGDRFRLVGDAVFFIPILFVLW